MTKKSDKNKKEFSRYSAFYIIMFIIFGVILTKLLYIQVYKYDDYKERADIGSTRFIEEKAPRGKIYDSEGNVLATNKQNYVLAYMQTEEADKAFYTTMKKVFTILEENNEKFQDDLLLKINDKGEFYFNFKSSDASSNKASELRFKKDRGLNDIIKNKQFKDVEGDLTDAQLEQIDEQLMKITPEQTFYYLVEQYSLHEMLLPENYTQEEYDKLSEKYEDVDGKTIFNDLKEKFNVQEIRLYMVIKDSIKIQSYKGYRSVTISNNIKRDTAFVIYQKLNELPGINVVLEPVRYYPFGALASHLLGYVSTIDSTLKDSYELRGYDISTDLIGASGVEGSYEEHLKGNKGGNTIKVNSQGRPTEELFRMESYPGNNVHLTIDKNVQYAAEEGLKDTLERIRVNEPSATRGAVVAIEVDTGKVIAMASYPEYDPNDFSIPGELSDEKFAQYFNPDLESFGKDHIKKTGATKSVDELFPKNENGLREDFYDIYPRPMFNYATLGRMPPGSVFKPLTSIAGLMEGVISIGEYMNDFTGRWVKDGMDVENFQGVANGPTDVKIALQKSSNYFFYETGYRMYHKNGGDISALDSLAKYAYKFGLGVDPKSEQAKNPGTGIEIEESFGQTFNSFSWKNRVIDSHMFNLVDAMRKGNIKGTYLFVPLDIGKNDLDNDELKQSKEDLKSKINDEIKKIGTGERNLDLVAFSEKIKPDILNIMNNSDSYKENVKKHETSTKQKISKDEEIQIIADGIADYTLIDMYNEVTSFAQVVYDAIGQGMNSFTPLQIANYTATLANGGTRYKVSLVDKITDPNGDVIQEFKPEVVDKLDIPPEYLQVVKEGMRAVNTYPGNGTAYQSFADFPIAVCGKTGTADFGTELQYDEQGRNPNGNYISFAPMDKPKIAIFSTLYDGNRGSEGATVHKAIYEAYFAKDLEKISPSYVQNSPTFKKYVTDAPKDNKEITR